MPREWVFRPHDSIPMSLATSLFLSARLQYWRGFLVYTQSNENSLPHRVFAFPDNPARQRLFVATATGVFATSH